MRKFIIVVIMLFVSAVLLIGYGNRQQQEPKSCRNIYFTKEYLQGFAEGSNIDKEITQEYVNELNKRPHCIDFCKEQLEYSKKYKDWFAEGDLRETCKAYGIYLPE